MTNLYDVTFIDFDRIFPIVTNFNDGIIPTSKRFYDYSTATAMLDSALGDDQYTLYTVPTGYNYRASTFNDVSPFIPSLKIMYPNIYEYFDSVNPSLLSVHIHFPGLNKLMSVGHSSDGSGEVYSIGSDGKLTSIGSGGSAGVNIGVQVPQFLVYRNYNSESGFVNTSDFGRLTADENRGTYSLDIYWGLDICKYLFVGAKPDGVGPWEPEPDDPYGPGGSSGPGDLPPGTFDDTSDPIPYPSLPTLSSADTGFTRIYNPTLAQVQALANYLWTDESVLQTIWNHIKQIFEDPMQAMIGFNLVPCKVPDGGTKNFALMYIDTGVQMTAAASQFVDVDCGTLKLERYYGSALDQAPYTKVSAFLPFIGNVSLNTDEVMGTTLHVIYRIDIASGACIASILVDENVLYQYSGHCAINIPFSSADFASYASSIMAIAKLGVDTAVGAGNVAAKIAKEAQQQTNNVSTTTTEERTTERNPASGRQILSGTRTITSVTETPREMSSTHASYAGMIAQNISNTVSQVMSSKPHIQHSGSFTGNSGYLGVRRPYLIIERPNMCRPQTYQSMNGFPCMMSLKLGDVKGYTEVYQVRLNGMTATNPEQAEILELLKSGVVL